MEKLIVDIVNNYGHVGICLMIFLENVLPIIPGVIIIFLGGYISAISNLSLIGIIASSVLGSLFGAILLYYLGKTISKERLKKIVKSKYLKFLRIKVTDIEKSYNWFNNKGNISVFYGRFIPIIRSVISIPAGMSKMPIIKYLIYTFLGSLLCNGILATVGYYANDKKDYIISFINKISYALIIMIILVIIYYLVKFYKRKKK